MSAAACTHSDPAAISEYEVSGVVTPSAITMLMTSSGTQIGGGGRGGNRRYVKKC